MHVPIRRASVLAALGAVALRPVATLAQPKPVTIIMGGLPEDSATPVLYAISSGAFRRAGLDVSLQPQRSGPAVTSGVVGGSYQIGKASLNPLVDAHAKGVPLVVVAPGGMSTADHPIAGLMVKVDSPIKTASDLNGKTIAVGALNDIFTLAMRSWMDRNGGDSTSLKLVEIPISAIAEAIAQGRVAAGSANEPILGGALASGKVRVIAHTFDAIAPRFMFTAWFTTRAWAEANRSTVASFARVVGSAAAFANANPGKTVDDIAKFTGIDPAVVARMPRTQAATSLDPALVQPVIDAAARYKDIPSRFDAKELIWMG